MEARRLGWILAVAGLLMGCRGAEFSRHETALGRSSTATLEALAATPSPRPSRDAPVKPNAPGGPSAEVIQASANVDGPAPSSPTGAPPRTVVPAAAQINAATVPITLDEAIATSLASNPTLVAQRASEPVADAVQKVAQTYPFNPFVQVEVLPYSQQANGNPAAVQHYVWLMQTLELAHQQRYREAGASAALNQVRWTIVQAELTTTAMTERLYFTALYQRELRDLAQRTAVLNERLLAIVERRFKANLGTPAEQTTARVAARQSRKQAALAEANFQTAVLALRRQLNVSNDAPINVIGRLEDFHWRPVDGSAEPRGDDMDGLRLSPDLCDSLAAERPDVMAAQSGTSAAQSAAELARANMFQNLGIGPYYERDNAGVLMFGFRTQMSLPVWDTGRPLAKQREAEVAQQAATLEQLRSRAQVEIETAVERYERARRLAVREQADFSRTPQELERIQHQFAAGQADILNVFAAQNSLLQEERAYLDLLNELAQAASDVTLAAGLPPARIVSAGAAEVPLLPPAPPAR